MKAEERKSDQMICDNTAHTVISPPISWLSKTSSCSNISHRQVRELISVSSEHWEMGIPPPILKLHPMLATTCTYTYVKVYMPIAAFQNIRNLFKRNTI